MQTWLENGETLYPILSKNGYQTKSPHIKSTGFRMTSFQYQEREQLELTAELFLINSFLKRNDPEMELSISSYLTEEGMKMVSLIGEEDHSAYPIINLGENAMLNLSLGESIVRRRSIRDFTGDPIHLTSLATLIRATAGVSALSELTLTDSTIQFRFRTAASGGSLYPIDLYVINLNAPGLTRSIYKYLPIDDQLIEVGNEKKLTQLLKSFSGSVDMVESSNASLIFLYVGKPWRSMRKYGSRGLRFVFQEVGAMTQNLHLAATALGLGSVDCASFFEDEIHHVLDLDGIHQCALHSVLIGVTA